MVFRIIPKHPNDRDNPSESILWGAQMVFDRPA
jgi:hypothetical protein